MANPPIISPNEKWIYISHKLNANPIISSKEKVYLRKRKYFFSWNIQYKQEDFPDRHFNPLNPFHTPKKKSVIYGPDPRTQAWPQFTPY